MIDTYIHTVASITKRGDAREESYYAALAALLEEYAATKRKKNIQVTVLPKPTEAGNPDFRVWDGKHSQVGYVEAKPPGANLDEIEDTDQLERYISTFPNLILTNFYEFRLFRNGKQIDCVLLARPFIPTKLKAIPPAEHTSEFLELLEKFFRFSLPEKFTAETLARELAVRTRFLRDEVIKEELRETRTEGARKILGFYEAFQKHLLANLKPEEFADLYSQTITYGLFAARTRATGHFNRKLAYDLIPKTIGILREIFSFISLDPPPQMEATVDDIAEVLAAANVKDILHEYFKKGKGTDPIFHFYETFLAEYNPRERERRGVYYTPEPVVSYIVRSVDMILRDSFGREDGFASQSVTVLDPAAGTLTFLAEAAKLAVDTFVSKYGEGTRTSIIQDHILKNFYGFELMMAPYAAGHLKMGYLLDELGHKLSGEERFQFYLTNTLEMDELAQTSLPWMTSLSEESRLAGKVKKERPILVILGNPPYSGHSSNKGDWITKQIETYKQVDGKPLGERNPKWLQDDYVKFIRFAQWKIDQAGEGILGFITNHSYLDNPTFRGMRQSLMNTFDQIYVLDLHGNSLKKERAPDGSKDENVFDIQQGVAIALFVKYRKSGAPKKIGHSDIWGVRQQKYRWLLGHRSDRTKWKVLKPSADQYLFVPRDETELNRYESYAGITGIFPVNALGFQTHRDHFAIDSDINKLKRRMKAFVNPSLDDEFIRKSFELSDTGSWKLKEARMALASGQNPEGTIVEIDYRPFDKRYLIYHDSVVDRTRREVTGHMVFPNVALNTVRQTKMGQWSHCVVSSRMTPAVFVEIKDGSNLFPLYLYETATGGATAMGGRDPMQTAFVFEAASTYGSRRPNVDPALLDVLRTAFGKQPSPEDILQYIYAILYSNSYRTKYSQFLRTDFPRIPFTRKPKLFQKLADIGGQLVELHLLRSSILGRPIARCKGNGTAQVTKVSYDPKEHRVYINPDKYFSSVSINVWEYNVGGYQVCEKWLKDRKSKTLSAEEIVTYTKIVTAIAETIKIQSSLDDLFNQVEASLLEINLESRRTN